MRQDLQHGRFWEIRSHFDMPMTERREHRIRSVLMRRQPGLTVVMEDIHDPHNVSAILRTADAVGALCVQLVYTKEKFPKLGKKSSASAIKWVQRRPFRTIRDCYGQLRLESYRIYATQLGESSCSLYDLDLTQRVAIVFGNEHRGVSTEAAELADAIIQIPMVGMIESLNVSVACAVTLYEAFRQRWRTGMYDQTALSPDALEQLVDQWTRRKRPRG
jgi:tRNA (guanosine-2'-O-)-methyltransferase